MLDAVILGIVQGLTEFLPISSSGHLVLGQHFLGVLDSAREDVVFEVLLHLGTLVAVLVAYRHDIARLLLALRPDRWRSAESAPERRLLLAIAVASIPAAAIGILFKGPLQAAFGQPQLVAVLLLVTGTLLLIGDRLKRGNLTPEDGGPWRALFVGCAQALAILPGISRAGSTIVAGIAVGLKPVEAARLSFLISIPAVAGAALLELQPLLAGQAPPMIYSPAALLAGFLSSALVGYLALQWLLVAVRRRNLSWFAAYCLALGGGVLLLGWV
jgi:undecaprenyl-diphosphatase